MEDTQTELDKLIAEEEAAVAATATETQPTVSDDKLKQLEAQKLHWRTKALDPKTGKAWKTLYEEANAKPAQSSAPDVQDRLDSIELSGKGLDAETIGFVKTYAKGAGKSPLEVLGDETVKSFIELRKEKARLAEAVPASSSRGTSVPLTKPYGEMTVKERQELFEKQRQSILGK